jgi:hypothetical protein
MTVATPSRLDRSFAKSSLKYTQTQHKKSKSGESNGRWAAAVL